MKGLTTNILDTFKKCNPQFFYNPTANPKRCLTYPPEGCLFCVSFFNCWLAIYNDGYDNIFNEYIIYLNEIIKSPENHEYPIQNKHS